MEIELSQKLEQFFRQFQTIHVYKRREIIVRAGNEPKGMYYLKSGLVRLYALSDGGREITFNIFKSGSVFSLMWALGGVPNNYYFEALTETRLWRCPKNAIMTFLQSEPQILFDLTRRVLVGLDGLLHTTELLLFGNAYTKVMVVILQISKRFGKPNGRGVLISLRLTHQEIASLAGLTRETTTLAIKKLKKQNLLAYRKRFLFIKNRQRFTQQIIANVIETSPPNLI